MSEYQHPYKDVTFALRELVGFDQLCEQAGLDEVNGELAEAILEEAGKFGAEVLAPLNQIGDREGATLGEQGVQETAGFAEAYQAFVESGWPTLTFPGQFGGQALPNVLGTAVNEVWQSANLSYSLCPLLTQGATEAILHHASDELKAIWLPKMVSGEWTGTMNLTEPGAGSDLAAITTRAVPEGDHYLITGQKIFITWGDHQMTPNTVHLVLARLPDAPAGVKGISLFIVPKFLLDEQGEPSVRNDAHCVSLEHKLGIHASPTCVMSFGDNGGAVGYLVGEPHQGLAYMFTMMNHARQAVGLQGLGISERSYQQAVAYARERIQGTRRDGSKIAIIEFPDVRRMLMQMRASIEAMRGLALLASAEADRAKAAGDEAQARQHNERVELFTPIVKGWLTEMSQEITYLGVQVHGGMGFIEETGSAQHYRDARILTIYEGTTGIQALDLVGRKILRNQGVAINSLLDEIDDFTRQLASDPEMALLSERLSKALEYGRQATRWLLETGGQTDWAPGAVSVPFMMLMGYLCGAWVSCRMAQSASAQIAASEGDIEFLQAKVITARFFCEHLLPRTSGLLETILNGSESVIALPESQF
ncbi:acyl-CoA dehydrogenase [Marinobacterium sp. D7]|uniref:acyl-CoA dehydrogenase n=1 Tax=Marinobacterium ramblicola TaxID=2849041 RepID=UPI001C2DEB5D|nr:acyl-CoA dehydrogenase [Marinobacterium ramblicola]MBV1790696.1 acyl-CoA dehydrogenase [Marinobacterium ramblicola]